MPRKRKVSETEIPQPKFYVKNLGKEIEIEAIVYRVVKVKLKISKDKIPLLIGGEKETIREAIKNTCSYFTKATLDTYLSSFVRALKTSEGRKFAEELVKLYEKHLIDKLTKTMK